MARHRSPGLHLPVPRVLLSLPAALILAVVAYGAVVALYVDPPNTATATATLRGNDHREAKEGSNPLPTITRTDIVDPTCYAVEGHAKVGWCQDQVMNRTKFIDRYRGGQPVISSRHPDHDNPNTLNKINGSALARHGLELCWAVAQPGTVRNDVIERFMAFHAHPGPVTPESADQVTRVALGEICQNRRSTYAALPRF